MTAGKAFYITTPLYYVNAEPHIGHAYTTVAADILRRYRRMTRDERVHLLTGTDEHGSKISEVARAAGKSPSAYADEVSQSFRDLWKHLDVHYDDFIRTTEPRHELRVQAAFAALLKSKDIYRGKYRGYYCVPCESHWTETDVSQSPEARPGPPLDPKRPPCPGCGKPLSWVEEESYCFALSKYQDRLLAHYRTHPDFLRPAHRANEILRFVESGLRDLSVTRLKSRVPWGIPVPSDPGHTIYVWFDALLNYVTAAGYRPPGWAAADGQNGNPPTPGPGFEELWPADIHLVGKEIYRFHAVIWPAMLLALGLEPPRGVFAHGWWTVEGQKMSKSKGNFVDPRDVTREFGVDALRYFLFREMPFGNDGDFSIASLRKRYNAELANDLGNLLSRVVQMVDGYLQGELPRRPPLERPLLSREVAAESAGIYECLERLAFSEALVRIWACISRLNRHVDKEAPWKLAKSDPDKLKFLLFDLVWSLRIIAGWLSPFMPQTAAKMQTQLGVRKIPSPLEPHAAVAAAGPDGGNGIHKAPPLFPRK